MNHARFVPGRLLASRPAAAVNAWYQRFWKRPGAIPAMRSSGSRPRTPTPPAVWEDLAGWLMEERAATNDARWPTLLYPIHYLEQNLKKQLDAATRGWPQRGKRTVAMTLTLDEAATDQTPLALAHFERFQPYFDVKTSRSGASSAAKRSRSRRFHLGDRSGDLARCRPHPHRRVGRSRRDRRRR